MELRHEKFKRFLHRQEAKQHSWLMVVQAVALSLFAGWQSTAAQDKQAGAPPLRLSTQGLLGLDKGCKAGEGLIVELHYIGEKPLRGYVLTLDSADSGVMKPKNDEPWKRCAGWASR